MTVVVCHTFLQYWKEVEFLLKSFLFVCIDRVIRGGNGLADGPVKPEVLDQVMKKVSQQGFAHKPEVGSSFLVSIL